VAALLTATAMFAAGCAAPAKNQAPVAEATSVATDDQVEAGLQSFYDQPVDWTVCGDFQCATVTVPVDYADPDAGSLDLAMERIPARDGDPIGSLFVNPGGPGASGIEFMDTIAARLSEGVLDRYDVVGFDPRGVGQSHPVTCGDAAQKDALVSRDFDFATDAGIQEAIDAYGAFGEACAAGTGPLLPHVDTESAARDLDVLRATLGDDVLHYLGYSYGTLLGATYAGLFPEGAGRLVLDGAVPLGLNPQQAEIDQAVGFEGALRAYVENCQAADGCPLTGSVDEGLEQVHDLVDRARRSPLDTSSGRPLTGRLAFYGVALPLYNDASWPALTQALTTALQQDDGSRLLQLADVYNDRAEDGTFTSNSVEANLAIGCADGGGSTDPDTMRAEAADILEAAPTVGQYFVFGGVRCAQWPVQPGDDGEPPVAEGAAPILVVGTTNDPATPYAWAEQLADELPSGVLVTWEGQGHTAYGRSNECVAAAVDGFLLEGTVPAEGTRC
jgi:pimeloyl-ACP methyl ester carboxylesterase